ncbi:hypothetical protein NPS70_18170 [Streptomyces sp. C10-9-1]|uniref:DUF7848 domain-containing protein n=1 Tax=Streptomyces sp. C10-9-1 TaxID=1859285 RepID=UPI0021113EB5|nr:hypothetical protein [Streptomyces sp. C10-9-1]MCQ6555102.1 hypothetical protein [Streptomyces sp. C10-9-1]
MTPRAAYRHVDHTIRHAPDGDVTYAAFCATADCEARSGPQDRQETAQDWALRHAGLTGHRLFRRVYTDHAEVTWAGVRGR